MASKFSMEPRRRIYRLEVEAEEVELLTIKDFVQRNCDAAGCTPKETSNIKLALDEACSNIIRHAYRDMPKGKIALEMGIGYKDLRIKVTDFGKSFDFRKAKDPDLNQYVDIGRKGGLGIWLIKRIMDRVDYRSHDGQNDLILYKKLSKATPQELGLRRGTISVSAKFTFGSVTLVILLSLSAFFYFAYRQQALLAGQVKDRVRQILPAMASEAGDDVFKKNDLGLDHLIKEVFKQDPAKIFNYAFIVGKDNKILAHSDLTQLFKIYSLPPGARPVNEGGFQVFKQPVGKGLATDYAFPIFYKSANVGELHIGVDDT